MWVDPAELPLNFLSLTQVSGAGGSFLCEHCSRVFRSARGLSLHKLRAHMAPYMRERSALGGLHLCVLGSRLWMPEEVNELAPLCWDMPSARVCGLVATALDTEQTGKQVSQSADSCTGPSENGGDSVS